MHGKKEIKSNINQTTIEGIFHFHILIGIQQIRIWGKEIFQIVLLELDIRKVQMYA
jgi:hypothetical protein